MGRARISMELIQNEKTRRTTFRKRKEGLMKKVKEFSILCDVDVCVIIYDEGSAEPETWPQEDKKEVQRIIQKYYNTTSDKRRKPYDVHEYLKDKMKTIEAEISKVRKEKLKILYPSWDDTFNHLGEEQLRMFVSMLDAKLDACNQKINILKRDRDRDLKGKAIEQDHIYDLMMQKMAQGQVFPPPPMNMMKSINDENQLAFFPFHYGQSSQPPSLIHFGQNGTVDWADNQVGALAYDPITGMLTKGGGAENSQNFYCNGNIQRVQPYSVGLHSYPPSQKSEEEEAFLPPPPGFQHHGFCDTKNVVQAQMFSHMHGIGRK